MKNFFKKLKYCFVVERTKNQNARLPYKNALPDKEEYKMDLFARTVFCQ